MILVGYGACAAAYLLVCLQILLIGRWPLAQRAALALPALTTSAWAGLHLAPELAPPPATAVLAAAAIAAWIVPAALAAGYRNGGRAGAVFLLLAGLALLAGWAATRPPAAPLWLELAAAPSLLMAVAGLMLLEQALRRAGEEERWRIKHFAFGLGILFAYDLYLQTEALMVRRFDPLLEEARPFVAILCAPLLSVSLSRMAGSELSLRVSPKLAVGSVALTAAGLYLLAMALVGVYVRDIGGQWGRLSQTLVLVGAGAVLVVAFASRSLRSHVRVVLAKHLLAHRYDYRHEWLRFIRTVAAEGDSDGPGLSERVLRAVADIVDSPGGALWQRHDEDGAFLPTARWMIGDERLPALPLDAPLAQWLETTRRVVDVAACKADPASHPGLVLPSWLSAHPRAGIVVPLVNRDRLSGILLLAPPRAPRPLDWEDFDILRTVGHHAAGYLAEEQALTELSDARRLQEFNRRSAFLVHDIKNIVSQMSLLLENARRLDDSPEFRRDMLDTVANSIDRMRTLLRQLKAEPAEDGAAPCPPQPLSDILLPLVRRWHLQKPDFVFTMADDGLAVTAPAEPLTRVLDHLILNAVDAAGSGRVALSVGWRDGMACLEIEDDGPGMSQDYVREHLFRPLRSDKADGTGIGVFQCREMVREMGGRLEVSSETGRGTRVRVMLPAVERAASDSADTSVEAVLS